MVTARRRQIIGFIVSSIVVAVFMHATAAQASPTITVSSPPAGQPLYDLRPTITVAYTSDDPLAPLNVATLRVTVNGFDWTAKFTAGPDSASYAVTVDDELIAGVLTIAASISDTAGVSASTAANYEVFPKLSALAPSTAEAGDMISLMASGLDPSAGRNKALLTPSGLTAALSEVDRAIGTGRFTLPAGTTSGDVGLEVNGKVARERIQLAVPSVVPNCGGVRSLFAMADGGWLVAYGADFFNLVDPQCPAAQIVDFLKWRFVKVTPEGELLPLPVPAGNGLGFDVRIIPDKRRSDAAILRRNLSLPVVVRYKDVDTFLPGLVSAADFDRDGNLFVLFFDSGFRIYRVSKEALAQGGDATLEPIVQLPVQSGGPDPYGFVISCDGFAYAAFNLQLNQYPWVQPRIFKVDLAARAVVGDRLLGVGEELHNLALSCQTNELWSARFLNIQENTSAAIARTEVIPNGFGISEDVFVTPAAAFPIGVAVGVGGTVYFETGTNAILAKRGAINACPVSSGALPVCETPKESIVILPSTARWKPQRTDDPINVVLGSSVQLDAGQPFTLRYTGKKPDGTIVAATSEVQLSATALGTAPQGYAYGYSLDWNHADATGAKLPAANYTLVVKAPVLSNQSPVPPPVESAEYGKVSLIEVVAITIEDASGVALQNNPSQGGGKRIFAEAAQPGGMVTDKLKVTATIMPPVPDAPAGQGVIVHFRSFDVDDPSASTAPVDDEAWPTDNCIEASAGPPQNCPVPDAGFLYDPATDPIAGSAVNGTSGLQLNAAADQAVAGLRVAMLAGANYRVVASTSSQWLGTLSAPGNRTDGAVTEGTTVLAEGQQVTPMVTVWRTLHLQPVRMTLPSFTQSAFEHQATAACPMPPCILGNVLQDTNGIPHPDHGTATDTWMGADLDVTPATPQGAPRSDKYVVINSTATTLTAIAPLTPYDPTFAYVLWDDEVDSLSIWTQPDDSLARDILRDAYVEVDTVTGLGPDFSRNLSDVRVAALPTASASSPEYWTAPLVMAFEGPTGKDGDPSTEEFLFGLTNGPEAGQTSRQPRVAIFSETIRDYRDTPLASPPAPASRVRRDEVMTNTTAHEILHMFGLIHDGNRAQGGIMCASLYVDGNEANRKKVTPEQLKLIREATEMKIRRIQVNCP